MSRPEQQLQGHVRTQELRLVLEASREPAQKQQPTLTVDRGWRRHSEVPQAVLEAGVGVRVIRGGGGRRRGHKVGQRDSLGEGVQAHGVKVAGSQGLGVVGVGVEGPGQLVQGAVEGRFEDAGGTHT